MSYSPIYKAALIASLAHENQTDMLGKPYFDHCERVANNVYRWAEGNIYAGPLDDLIAVAYLHDVVEDTEWTLGDLERLGGFSETILAGVDAMTQRWVHVGSADAIPLRGEDDGNGGYFLHDDPDSPYWDREPLEAYWTRVRANPIARIVKVHGDIPDNNDPKRKQYLDQKLQDKLTDKYARALAFLQETP